MTARFISCAPLNMGGDPLAVFGPSDVPVTWQEHSWQPCGNGNLARFLSQAGGTLILDTNDGTGRTVTRSTDGGLTWAEANVSGLATSYRNECGGDGQGNWLSGALVYTSTDDGATWAEHQPATYLGGLSDPTDAAVFYLKAAKRWIGISLVSNSGSIYTTATPFNFPWTKNAYVMGTGSGHGATDTYFDGTTVAILGYPAGAGANGIITTTDGATFTAYTFTSASAVHWIAAGGGRCVACTNGNNADIWVGSTWAELAAASAITVPTPDGSGAIQRVAADLQGRIYAVSTFGSVYFSNDGGGTWVADTVPWPHNGSSNTFVSDIQPAPGGAAMVIAPYLTSVGVRPLAC